MTSVLGLMLLGLFLGMRHATDPDHVIAVTTIVSRHRAARGAAAIGAAWGLGHTLTILLIGSGIIVFGWVIPPRLGLTTELTVGVMLIALGVISLVRVRDSLRLASRDQRDEHGHIHVHAHAHGDYVHTHAHRHSPEVHPHSADATPVGWLDRHLGALRGYQLVRPLLVGIVHGLAGSAAAALLVLATIRSPRWAVLYLLLFGLGTIVGMMLMTTMIVLPFAYSERQFTRFNTGLRIASGVISLGFGLFVAYQMGIVHGLFTAHPQWTPE